MLHVALALTKASAILLYRRIFVTGSSGFERRFEYVLYGTLAVIAAWMITFSFLAGFQCGPDHLLDAWDKTSNKEYCGIANVYAYGFFVSDIVLDVWVICLPIPSVSHPISMNQPQLTIVPDFSTSRITLEEVLRSWYFRRGFSVSRS